VFALETLAALHGLAFAIDESGRVDLVASTGAGQSGGIAR